MRHSCVEYYRGKDRQVELRNTCTGKDSCISGTEAVDVTDILAFWQGLAFYLCVSALMMKR